MRTKLLASSLTIAFIVCGCDKPPAVESHSDKTPENQSTKEITQIFGDENREADIVFLHGLGGDSVATWSSTGGASSLWPTWIGEDLHKAGTKSGIWAIQYNASPQNANEPMPISDRARHLLNALADTKVGVDRPIVFVTHSLGGLIVKKMMQDANEIEIDGSAGNLRKKAILSNCRGIVFLATPHTGSDMATLISNIGGVLDLPSDLVRDLRANDSALRDLNRWFQYHVSRSRSLSLAVYYETLNTHGIRIVSPDQADPHIVGVEPIPCDNNHLSICKPKDRDSLIYISVLRFLKDQLNLEPERMLGIPREGHEPIALKLRLVPKGTFVQGSKNGDDDEKPVINRTIEHPFYIGETEVTQAQYDALMPDENFSPRKLADHSLPITNVTFRQAATFCNRLSASQRRNELYIVPVRDDRDVKLREGGNGFRLPTEMEWEYCCRAGSSDEYCCKEDELDEYAWYEDNSDDMLHPVGKKHANKFGLFDMHGNAIELCDSWLVGYEPGKKVTSRPKNVARGGGFRQVGSLGAPDGKYQCRSAYRHGVSPDNHLNEYGFRIVYIP